MTDNELLLAISNMLDPIREEIQDMKEEIRGVKEQIREIKIEIQDMKENIQEIEDRVKRIELTHYDRYKDNVKTYESIKQDVSILKRVVAEHSEKLQKIS